MKERSNEAAPKGRVVRNTKMLKHVCVRVNDPKNTGSKTEYTVIRVPMPIALDTIKNYGTDRAWFVAKKSYKNFIRTVTKGKDRSGVTTGITRQEIRHCAILKKEMARTAKLKKDNPKHKGFSFPIFSDDNQEMLTSDLRDFEREQKIKDNVHNRGNNRKTTKSRKRNMSGSYVYGGARVHASNATYQKAAQAHSMQQAMSDMKRKAKDADEMAEPVQVDIKEK